MSRTRNFVMTSGANSPQIPHPVLPFRKTKSTTKTPDNSYYPLAITEAQSREWWWRFKTLVAYTTYDGGLGLQPGMKPLGLARLPIFPNPSLTEKDLNLPGFSRADTQAAPLLGAFVYFSDVSYPGWNGDPDSRLDFTTTLSIFGLGGVGSDKITHAYWRTDTNIILPSFEFSCEISITTPGTETGATVVSVSTTDPHTDSTGAVLVDNGGGDVVFRCVSSDGASCAVEIAALEWFPRTGASGPVWDSATGGQLQQVYQVPL